MKFNQMPQEQGKLPTLLGSIAVPVGEMPGQDEDLDVVIEKIAQKLGESGLPSALKFMSKIFGPMEESTPKDITNRCRWWETAWKRKQEGRDECMNIPEAQKFSRMALILAHEVYMLDDATWSAISGVDVGSSCPKDTLIEMLDKVRRRKEDPLIELEDPSIVSEDCVVDAKDCYPAGQAPSPDSLLSSPLQLEKKTNLRGKILGIRKVLSDPLTPRELKRRELKRLAKKIKSMGSFKYSRDWTDPASWVHL